jgi:hypothetical protein
MQYFFPGMIIQRHPDPQQDKDICCDDGRLNNPLQPMPGLPIIIQYQKTAQKDAKTVNDRCPPHVLQSLL